MSSAPQAQPQINPWLIAIAVMSSTFMEVLDTTVVNVSLPHIAGSLSASTDEATWTLTSYLVANAIILPMTGWLAGRFGRKRLLMMAVTGFTVASFFCGLAPSLPFLIIFRIIQGACGGGLQPLSQAILLESSLSFLGLGDPNLISWGYMVGAGRTVVRQAWWITVFPGFAILLSVLGLNLVGEGLNDALNPRLAGNGR